ncbi:GtrA family protein [Enterovibrio coralii]|uniref:GtrA/DPMS transmembrane domain-containing protein n=1 Tax=Enterovibrio coralii TaxID=294935 RepID=A0A135I7D8_9GAMM|nr:hypothetical protein ATN88_01110 [Enterovibrio coralii]
MKTISLYILFQLVSYSLEFSSFYLLAFVFSVDVIYSNILSKVLSATTAFFCHKYFTFKVSDSGNTVGEAGRYIVAIIINMVVSSSLLYILVGSLPEYVGISKLFSDVFAVILSFIIVKKFVYRA